VLFWVNGRIHATVAKVKHPTTPSFPVLWLLIPSVVIIFKALWMNYGALAASIEEYDMTDRKYKAVTFRPFTS
jgi:hypothetical protein